MGWNDRYFNPYDWGITPESMGMNQEDFDREYFSEPDDDDDELREKEC